MCHLSGRYPAPFEAISGTFRIVSYDKITKICPRMQKNVEELLKNRFERNREKA